MRQLLLLFSFLVFALADLDCPDEVMNLQLTDTLGDLNLADSSIPFNSSDSYDDTINVLDNDLLTDWENKYIQSAKNNLTQMTLSRNSMNSIIVQNSFNTKLRDEFLFNIDLQSPNTLNDQFQSGRCWIFATCNVLRSRVINKYNLGEEFQLSQAYLYFYDQLEKSNVFLQDIVEQADQPFETVRSRFLQPLYEGGAWQYSVNLINKYGLVPNNVFPDNFQLHYTDSLQLILAKMLREFGLKLRQLAQDDPDSVEDYRQNYLQVIYNTLAMALGTPPKPNDEFTWEFIDKDRNFTSFSVTPLSFYQNHVDVDVNDYFYIMSNPTLEYNQLYYIDGPNVVNGLVTSGVNVEIDQMRDAAIKMLKDGKAVFFAAEAGAYADEQGVFDVDAFDYAAAFNFDFSLTKEQLILTGSVANHAMAIDGVHLDPKTGKPVRWKVQNSWGKEAGKDGWFLMTDEWFGEFVEGIAVSKEYVSQEIADIWEKQEYLNSSD